MQEAQRLEMERNLATARRALFRAHEVAERGAYHQIEDALHLVNAEVAAIMDAVMNKREYVNLPIDFRAYL